MTQIITQFTPYTCTLDCWSHYLAERGIAVTTAEILRNHRDLCWHGPPNVHNFGSIEKNRFELLVRRYLMNCGWFVPANCADLANRITAGHGIFVFATAYHGNAHVMRAYGVGANTVKVLVPALPFGAADEATIADVQNVWHGEFAEVQ